MSSINSRRSSLLHQNDDFDSWTRSRQLLRPDDQMDLTQAELSEEIPKVLSSRNQNVPQNLIIYSFKNGSYVPIPKPAKVLTIFEHEGTIIRNDSAEAKVQIVRDKELGTDPRLSQLEPESKEEKINEKSQVKITVTETESKETDDADKDEENDKTTVTENQNDVENENVENGKAAEETLAEANESQLNLTTIIGGTKKKLLNLFNFCDHPAATRRNISRCVGIQTLPPLWSSFGSSGSFWQITDSYNDDFTHREMEREAESKKEKKAVNKNIAIHSGTSPVHGKSECHKKCNILERMVNQNIFDEIAYDFRYWEDPSDKKEQGSLALLWKFTYEKCKKLSVTHICLSTYYFDLFAVCFGSFEYTKQVTEGCVCLFSIKNPSFPEYRVTTESGAMCCDIHKKYPYLIVIGQCDGSVCVYNLQIGTKEAIYISQGVTGKHSESVNEIKWGEDKQDGERNFYSLSSDGTVFNWVLMQSKLTLTTIITLFLDIPPIRGPDETNIKLKASGTCMVFHPTDKEIFLIGTEEGLIFKCSTAYSSKYLMVYQAHYLSVYRIDYNKFDSNIFISCSGDSRVKIWEDMHNDPLFIFDLGDSVGDVKWAPYSSTVFAAVTTEGRVFVFDLNVNKYNEICSQQVIPRKKKELTRIAFNNRLPFITVGDNKGSVIALKLSPNLRLHAKGPKKGFVDQKTLQTQKLERLLSSVR